MLENPPGFGLRTEAQKAAHDNGYRLDLGEDGGWLAYESTTAPGRIWIGAASQQGPWFLSVDHAGVAAELGGVPAASIAGPGRATFKFTTITVLHRILDQVYRLSLSLPYAPLARFRKETSNLPSSTEAERVVIQRVGQGIFRDALLDYWDRKCPLTGITDIGLLRASHIVAWAECDSDEHRLDVHNGLLLSALWDAAFDRGLISFADDGTPLANVKLSAPARAALGFDVAQPLKNLRQTHLINLRRHRIRHGFVTDADP
jgi:HNH endonuclease